MTIVITTTTRTTTINRRSDYYGGLPDIGRPTADAAGRAATAALVRAGAGTTRRLTAAGPAALRGQFGA